MQALIIFRLNLRVTTFDFFPGFDQTARQEEHNQDEQHAENDQMIFTHIPDQELLEPTKKTDPMIGPMIVPVPPIYAIIIGSKVHSGLNGILR